jgi:nucleoside-diphosphate-sugar epimerase
MGNSSGNALIVVTGAGGFVGTALLSQLRTMGRRVRGLVRTAMPEVNAKTECRTVGDLATATDDALARALDGTDAVVHLAGRAHVMRAGLANPENAYREANVVASERLARAAGRAGVARFVYVSTIKVNGETTLPGRPFRESDPPHPEDAYGRTKWQAERALEKIAGASDMALTILRPPLMYGPCVRGNFLALWRAVARGVPLPFGRIDNRRSLLYVGNLVHAIVGLLDAPTHAAGTWVIADREAVSTRELVRRIAGALGKPARLVPVPVGLLGAGAVALRRRELVSRLTGSLEIDASALALRIGPPPYSLDEGLAATAQWWRTSRRETGANLASL